MAFARIAADTRTAHLALVGGLNDSYAAALSTLIGALGLEHRARVTSVTTDVAQWWTMANGFVLASDAESLPRSILEAMAYEVPVLATDVGGVSEVVHEGLTGFLVRPNDIEDLTLRIRSLLNTDPVDLKVMTEAAARELHTTRNASGYVDVYLRLLRGLARDPLAPPKSFCERSRPPCRSGLPVSRGILVSDSWLANAGDAAAAWGPRRCSVPSSETLRSSTPPTNTKR